MTDDTPRPSPLADVGRFLRDIKLEHSLFALPFAFFGMFLACAWQLREGLRDSLWPTFGQFACILAAMIGARTAAMGFNRVVDRALDARNPRTRNRPLAAGQAGLATYLTLIGLGVVTLFVAAAGLNPLAVRLAPVALAVLFFYSYTKRFTAYCHFFVGLALAIAPLAAWIGITGEIPRQWAPYWLFVAVLTWVAGFDIIYSTLDIEFDRAAGLHSLPSRLGLTKALGIARDCHIWTIAGLWRIGRLTPELGWIYAAGVILAGGLLIWEHLLVREDDLSRVNTAFFTLNGLLGILILTTALLDLIRLTG